MQNTANYKFKKPENTDLYNVQDFSDNMDAIDTALKGFEDGTTTVGNANKLGGKSASEYLTTNGGTIKNGGTGLSMLRDVNGVSRKVSYRIGSTGEPYIEGFAEDGKTRDKYMHLQVNKITTHLGELATTADLANYLPKSGGFLTDNQATILRLLSTSSDTMNFIKFYKGDENSDLGCLGFSDVDTPSFRSFGGVNYTLLHSGNVDDYSLPRRGGNVDGNVTILSNSAVDRNFILKNSKREILSRVSDGGGYILHDITNAKRIIESSADGTNTFNGTASGNLPLSGGTVAGVRYPLTIQRTDSNEYVYLIYKGMDGNELGAFGFRKVDEPIVYVGGNVHDLLHSGNVGSYALPLSGGTVSGSVKANGIESTNGFVHSTSSGKLRLYKFTDSFGDWGSQIRDYKEDGSFNALVLQNTNNIAWGTYDANGTKTGGGEIHHDGNSAKVAIQSTAPTDTSALWVW